MKNAYEDAQRAATYARLEFPGTYYLAYRDLPEIIRRHVSGDRAVDFGCGTGRSTRFLQGLGFTTTGIDISGEMIALAREADREGRYRLIEEGKLEGVPERAAHLVLSAFTFDNVPDLARKETILRGLVGLLADGGRIVNLVSSPEIYLHEWASFSTRDYPENAGARSGDKVRIIITDTDDPRPVEDVVCTETDYRALAHRVGLRSLEVARPLGRPEDPCAWVSEETIAPWMIHVWGREGE